MADILGMIVLYLILGLGYLINDIGLDIQAGELKSFKEYVYILTCWPYDFLLTAGSGGD